MTAYNKEQLLAIVTKGYEQQLTLYNKMLEIAAEQHQLCQGASFAEEDELKKLTELINSRQELVTQLDKGNQLLAKAKEMLADQLGMTSVKLSALKDIFVSESTYSLGLILDELGNLLKKINQLDQKSQELMNEKLKGVKAEINKMQAGKKAQEMYQAVYNQQPAPVFLDKKK